MTHEPDHLPGEAPPGTGLFRAIPLGLAAWAVIIIALVLLSNCVSTVEHTSVQRATITEPQSEPVVVGDVPGGRMQWGYDLAERYWRTGRPIRLTGRYTSAGTFLLWAVERLPGSCIEPDVFLDFHEPTMPGSALAGCQPYPLDHPDRAGAIRDITHPYNELLTAWFLERIVGDEAECLPYVTLRGRDMAAFGYPVCEGEDR